MSQLTEARKKITRWRENPAQFVVDNFGVEPDAWQLDVLQAFANPEKRRIAMQACAGPGKSAVLAWCGWNFLSCYGAKGEHPQAAVVACTEDNLKDNLWKEFSKWRDRSEFLKAAFTVTKKRIFSSDHPETWFLSARSFAKTADADQQGRTLSGLHSEYILYLVDESGDIAPAIGRAAEQGLSTGPRFGKIVQAGNPTNLGGMLYQAANRLAHQWMLIRITGDPEHPKRSTRIDAKWAQEQIDTYGRDNPWVMSYILGQFPPATINALLSPDEVLDAMQRYVPEDVYSCQARTLGVDIARYGNDRTIIFPRQGKVAFKCVEMRNSSGHQVAARVGRAWDSWDVDACFFDDTGGWAAAALEALQDMGYSPIPVNFASKPIDPRFFNKRAEMYFLMTEWVRGKKDATGGALPYDEGLKRELCAPQFTLKNGKFLIEEKEQIKKRLGFSPDKADGLATTFAFPVAPRGNGRVKLQRNKCKTEYDPYAETMA